MKHNKRMAAAMLAAAMLATNSAGLTAAAVTPYYHSFSYSCTDAVMEAVEQDFTEELLAEVEAKESAENKGVFRRTVEIWKKHGMYTPCIDGEPIVYADPESTGNVSLFAKDLYDMPALYYHPAEKKISYFVVQYLDEELAQGAQENGTVWLLNRLNPFADEESDILVYPSYDYAEEAQVNVGGVMRQAVIGRDFSDERTFCHFVYEDLLIKAACTIGEDADISSVLSSLTFQKENSLQVVDAVALHKFLMGKGKLSKDHHKKMDMTGDGVIDAFDLALMKRRLIEKRRPAQQQPQTQNVQMHKENTYAVTKEGWDAAFADASYVFTSPEQFEQELGSLVKAPVLRHLQKTYTADFFKENILCFKLVPVTEMQTLKVDTGAITIGDTIEIPYSFSGTAKYGSMVTAAELVLPKKSCQNQEIVWKQKDAKPITVKYSTESLYGVETQRNNDEALISTQEEMISFLSSTINEEGIADFKERYPESFFEENSLHMMLAWGHASGYALADAVKCGDTISLTLRKNDEYGCVEQSIRIAELSKADLEGAQLELRYFSGMYSPISNDADYIYGPIDRQALVVQSVDYAEESDIELIYIPELLIGCGIEPLAHCIRSVPMQEGGYMPITGEYTDPTWDEDFVYDYETPITFEGEDFRLVWREEGVCVQMKTSPDAETFEKTYIWEDPYQAEYFCTEHEQFYCVECDYEEYE